jgi:small multidrug resistance family-3 protein
VTALRSILLFTLAALAEIGGPGWFGRAFVNTAAWPLSAPASLPLVSTGLWATFQPDPRFGRILAAYGGVFVAGSLALGVLVDGFRPDRYDLVGAACAWPGWPSSCTPPGPARSRPIWAKQGGAW